jgi:hypothetical protein
VRSHYARNQPEVLLGHTLLRDQLLCAAGYHVLHVPWFEWEKEQTETGRLRAYLQGRLHQLLQARQ